MERTDFETIDEYIEMRAGYVKYLMEDGAFILAMKALRETADELEKHIAEITKLYGESA